MDLDLHVGRPLHRGPLTLFPVWNGHAIAHRDYTFGSTLTVEERAGSPVVHELVVHNPGPRPALVLEGELLEGGQQHRVSVRSVLVAPGDSQVLEVRCVEQGRWSGQRGHNRSERRAPVTVRAAAASQSQVWHRVEQMQSRFGPSQTQSLLDMTGRADGDAARMIDGVQPLAGQTGLIVGLGGQPLLMEVYDSPKTLARAWKQLLHAAAMDALHAPTIPTPGRRARRFAEQVMAAPVEARDLAVGRELRGATPNATVHGLQYKHRVVHAVAVNPRHGLVAA